MFGRIGLAGLALFAVSGCQTLTPTSVNEVVRTEEDIICARAGDEEWLDAQFDFASYAVVADSAGCPRFRPNLSINKILKGYVMRHQENWQEQTRPLLLFFNGGLNDDDANRLRIRNLAGAIEDDELAPAWPVFMSWSTGPDETYLEDTYWIRNGRFDREANRLLNPFGAGLRGIADLISGLGTAPVTYKDQLYRFVEARNGPEEAERYFVAEPKKLEPGEDGEPTQSHDEHIRAESRADLEVGRNLVFSDRVDDPPSIGAERLGYFANTATRGVTTPFIDGLGKRMWDNMKRRATTALRQPFEHEAFVLIDNDYAVLKAQQLQFPRGTGAFAQFFARLERCWFEAREEVYGETLIERNLEAATARNGETWTCRDKLSLMLQTKQAQKIIADMRLRVVAHSMGAIVFNQLAEHFPDLPYGEIVYMAAASSTRDTRQALGPLLRKAARPEGFRGFYNLMLHPINEGSELSALNGVLPSGSLLAYIDEMYEEPPTMLDRTMGSWINFRGTRNFFTPNERRQILIRVFDRSDPNVDNLPKHENALHPAPVTIGGYPVKHGDFNDCRMAFWRPTFWGCQTDDLSTDKGLVDAISANIGGAKPERPQVCTPARASLPVIAPTCALDEIDGGTTTWYPFD